MAMEIIFGFGSLINPDSLKSTIVDVTGIRPAYVKGFVREFNLWDPMGFRKDSPNFTGTPYCALDVQEASSPDSKVNGVVFKVNKAQLNKLKERERNYKLIKTAGYDFDTGKKLGQCYLFSARKNNGKYEFNSPVQKRYLSICLKGARKFGDEFYKEFINTTYIGDRTSSEVLELLDAD